MMSPSLIYIMAPGHSQGCARPALSRASGAAHPIRKPASRQPLRRAPLAILGGGGGSGIGAQLICAQLSLSPLKDTESIIHHRARPSSAGRS